MQNVWHVIAPLVILAGCSETAFINLTSKRRNWLLIVVCVVAMSAPSLANADIKAASCAASDVQSAINTATTGDLVVVPSGNCNWDTTTVSIAGKDITVQGAGIDVTNITATGNYAWIISRNSSRLTGFTVTVPTGKTAVLVDGDGWRVDHMRLVSATSGTLANGVWANGLRIGMPYGPTGLIDHVEFVDTRPLIFAFPDVAERSGFVWVSPLGLGDDHAVYIEDSIWTFNGAKANYLDCNYGGRWVMRFNTTVGSSSVDSHSNQAWRGCRRWELYNNSINFGQAYFTPVFIRGGTGVLFNNTIASGWGEPYISFDNVRSYEARDPLGQCNGTALADGNQLPNGWPCRDQIGWAQDTSQWTSTNPYPKQISTPAYLWNNRIGAKAATVNIRNGGRSWIQADRDYYNETASFNGQTGVGVGPIGSRPPTCTTGVAYWATDEGEWNSKQDGADGQLYKCTDTNTWTLYYKPFPYPHPLQTEETYLHSLKKAGTRPPAPPRDLRVR